MSGGDNSERRVYLVTFGGQKKVVVGSEAVFSVQWSSVVEVLHCRGRWAGLKWRCGRFLWGEIVLGSTELDHHVHNVNIHSTSSAKGVCRSLSLVSNKNEHMSRNQRILLSCLQSSKSRLSGITKRRRLT